MTDRSTGTKKSARSEDLELLANKALDLLWLAAKQGWKGVMTNTIPWWVYAASTLVTITLILRLDALVWRFCHGARFYPFSALFYWTYAGICILAVPFGWALSRVFDQDRLTKELKSAFINAGLETRSKKLPGIISDSWVDENTKKLKLASHGLTKADFERAQKTLESSLKVTIDEIKARIEQGTIELTYCYEPMPSELLYDPTPIEKPFTFLVGVTRTRRIYASLRETPHLLVGGQTVAGKSTFMRQTVMTLMLNNSGTEFTLIDLKEGVEFTAFAGQPRTSVYITPQTALEALKFVEGTLEKKLALLRVNDCSNIDEFHKIPEEKRKYTTAWPKERPFVRNIVAIDEAAQLFVGGLSLLAKEVQLAKRLTSRIGALGRAVGVHLIVATQRPDRYAVDPLIKTHMSGRLCFAMSDNASSMTILDSVRAADLPQVAGRAIWRNGLDQMEVHTPLLKREEMEPYLAPRLTGPGAKTSGEGKGSETWGMQPVQGAHDPQAASTGTDLLSKAARPQGAQPDQQAPALPSPVEGKSS